MVLNRFRIATRILRRKSIATRVVLHLLRRGGWEGEWGSFHIDRCPRIHIIVKTSPAGAYTVPRMDVFRTKPFAYRAGNCRLSQSWDSRDSRWRCPRGCRTSAIPAARARTRPETSPDSVRGPGTTARTTVRPADTATPVPITTSTTTAAAETRPTIGPTTTWTCTWPEIRPPETVSCRYDEHVVIFTTKKKNKNLYELYPAPLSSRRTRPNLHECQRTCCSVTCFSLPRDSEENWSYDLLLLFIIIWNYNNRSCFQNVPSVCVSSTRTFIRCKIDGESPPWNNKYHWYQIIWQINF